MSEIPDNFRWPPPWQPVPFPDGWLGLVRSAEEELQSEVSTGHSLFGVACRVVGFNAEDPNEFLFATDAPTSPLVCVHLTFQAEHDPSWPFTVGYAGWEEFLGAWVQ